jgi:lambda family phage portal protein
MARRQPTNDKRSRAERFGDALDNALSVVAPGWAAKRKNHRRADRIRARAAQVLNRHFEGSGGDDLRADKWLKSRLTPDDALEWELDDLRRRSDELYRNFGPCNGAIESRVDNVVGQGIRIKARIKEVPGKITAAQAEAWNAELDAAFERQAPVIGKSGRQTLADVQRLAERCYLRDGEAFVVISDVGRTDKPVPLQIEVIDPRRVETPPEFSGDPMVRFGIRFNEAGEILGYYIRSAIPGDSRERKLKYTWFDASRVRHIFEQLWPDQTRGIPWFSCVLNDVRDFKDFREAVIISAQVAACVTMVIGTTDEQLLAAGSSSPEDEDLQPGRILFRPMGTEVSTLAPAQPATTFGMFSEYSFLNLSAGLKWPFGWLTKDRRRASYSAGKLEEIEGGIVIRSDQAKLDDQLNSFVWARFVTECVILGVASIDPTSFKAAPWLYTRAKITGPGRPMIDPAREVRALVDAKNENLITLEEIHTKAGLDTDEVLERRAYERWSEGELGVVPPSYGQPSLALPAEDQGAEIVKEEIATEDAAQPQEAGA